MKKNSLIFWSLLLILSFTAYSVQASDLNKFLLNNGYTPVEITKNIAGHLMVKATVNGVEGMLIIDTGAGGTVIDQSMADTLKLKLELDNIDTTGAGAGGGMLQVIPSKDNTVILDKITIENFTLAVMNLEHVTSAYKQIGITELILGVIGFDLLESYKALIDYDNMKLWMKK